jgi:hypothetical protein
VSWASGYTADFSASDGVAAKAKATGKKEKQGVSDNGSSLPELVKTVKVLGGSARPAKSWADAMEAGKKGAALIIWVQQAVGYDPAVKISKWHEVWKSYWTKKDPKIVKAGYGHMTSAGWSQDLGWQWACPTRDDRKKSEQFGVQVTEAQLRAIASSKVKVKKANADYKCVVIVTHPAQDKLMPVSAQDKLTPVSAPLTEPVVAPASTPAPAPRIVVQAPTSHPKEVAMPKVTKTAATIAEAEAALLRVDWDDKSKEAVSALVAAAKASNGKKGLRAKISASVSWIVGNTGIDEMVIEALRTGIGTALALLLATGSQLTKLDADQADMILAGAIAACLQVIVRALNPDDPKFGVGKAKQEIRNGNGLHK